MATELRLIPSFTVTPTFEEFASSTCLLGQPTHPQTEVNPQGSCFVTSGHPSRAYGISSRRKSVTIGSVPSSTPPPVGNSVPFSDNANVDISPTHSASPLPSWVPETPENPLKPSAHMAPPNLKTIPFPTAIVLENLVFFLLYQRYSGWKCLVWWRGDMFMFFIRLPGWTQNPHFMSRPCLFSVSGSLGPRSLPSP